MPSLYRNTYDRKLYGHSRNDRARQDRMGWSSIFLSIDDKVEFFYHDGVWAFIHTRYRSATIYNDIYKYIYVSKDQSINQA